MLNMLIAIMGDTFDKVTENYQVYTTRTKLQILGDYVNNFTDVETENFFLFTMTVVQDEGGDEQGDNWEGSIQRMKAYNKKMFERLEHKFDYQLAKLSD